MYTYENGHRFENYDAFENRLHQPYNYAKYGLIKHLISHKISESKNIPLQAILKFIDQSFIYSLKYIDQLKNFKNYLWKNR